MNSGDDELLIDSGGEVSLMVSSGYELLINSDGDESSLLIIIN